MFQKSIRSGSREVIISANTPDGPFSSRLYVNCNSRDASSEPSMGPAAKAKTLKGAEKQAAKMLERR
jgi:hypothetical protein